MTAPRPEADYPPRRHPLPALRPLRVLDQPAVRCLARQPRRRLVHPLRRRARSLETGSATIRSCSLPTLVHLVLKRPQASEMRAMPTSPWKPSVLHRRLPSRPLSRPARSDSSECSANVDCCQPLLAAKPVTSAGGRKVRLDLQAGVGVYQFVGTDRTISGTSSTRVATTRTYKPGATLRSSVSGCYGGSRG